jgi:hypothetical protein
MSQMALRQSSYKVTSTLRYSAIQNIYLSPAVVGRDMAHMHSYDAPGAHKAVKLHILEVYLLSPHLPRVYTSQQLNMTAACRVQKGVRRTEQSSQGDGIGIASTMSCY